ncbi:MAG TPA: FHA domain-containing protein [Candidatus Mediterraneibacter merdipullorum]|nr:FHA domain-containing protein [Candidatus Mediterraneibacter merdipullorum]
MWYWIVMAVLAVGCVGMMGVSFGSIKKNKALAAAEHGSRRGRGRKSEYDEDDEDDAPPQRRRRQEPEEQPEPVKSPKKKKRRQWKIIMEDIDSWDKYSFTFYDTVGIGRGKDGSMYEKYLPIMSDGRISKMHCVIIHRGDKLYLKDEGSRNGTFLNGERIDRPVVIQRDDIIGVGETRLEVQRILRESES